MKITFILPAVGKKASGKYIRSWQMQPLTIATLAGLTPKRHQIAFYDDRLEDIPYDEATDLVVLTIETYTARRSYEIAAEFRKRSRTVVAGGFHATLLPEEVLAHVDAVTVGEAEGVWGQVLDDAENARLQRRYHAKQLNALQDINPDRGIFSGKKYLGLNLLEFSRGCRFGCHFCSIAAFYRQSYRHRPVGDVVKEIHSISQRDLFFVDDNILAEPAASRELFNALIPLKRRWISQCSLHVAYDEGLLRLMKQSGCYGLLIGFESLRSDNLSQMGKTMLPSRSQLEDLLGRIRRAGIKVYATFIFGYDADDRSSIEATLDFALQQRFFLAAFNHLVPFPGTPLFQQLRESGRLIHHQWWLDPGYRYGEFAFRPLKMEPKDLARACVEARKKFYSLTSIFRRSLDFNANSRGLDIMDHFAINLLLRGEVEQKFGFSLG